MTQTLNLFVRQTKTTKITKKLNQASWKTDTDIK
jgi:hypothetical protein